MAELGRIDPVRRLQCGGCGSLLPDWSTEELLSEQPLRCPKCGTAARIPEEVVERARKSRYLGTNLDFTA